MIMKMRDESKVLEPVRAVPDSSMGLPGLIAAVDAMGADDLPAQSSVASVCLLTGAADMGPIAELFGS